MLGRSPWSAPERINDILLDAGKMLMLNLI